MRAFKLLSLTLLFAAEAHAAEKQPWKKFAQECEGWDIKGFRDFLKSSQAWDDKNKKSQEDIQRFSHQTCPSYLGSANGAASLDSNTTSVNLDKFLVELQTVYADIEEDKTNAEKSQRFLDFNIQDWSAWIGLAHLKLTDHPCGARMVERRDYVSAEMKRLQKNVEQIRTQCPMLSEAMVAKAKERKPASPKGEGTGHRETPMKNSGSDITGTRDPKRP